MKYLLLFESAGLSSDPPKTLEEQIDFSMKWYPTLYDSKYGRIKVLSHMYIGYGTEYEWVDGELINIYDNNNDYDMYEYRYRVWQAQKKEKDERLERLMDHYEEMSDIIRRTTKPENRQLEIRILKKIQNEINELQDEIDNFNPYGKEYPDEPPLNVNTIHYSNYSPIFNIPDDAAPEYIDGAKEIVSYIMNNTTNDKIWSDFEPIAKELGIIK